MRSRRKFRGTGSSRKRSKCLDAGAESDRRCLLRRKPCVSTRGRKRALARLIQAVPEIGSVPELFLNPFVDERALESETRTRQIDTETRRRKASSRLKREAKEREEQAHTPKSTERESQERSSTAQPTISLRGPTAHQGHLEAHTPMHPGQERGD